MKRKIVYPCTSIMQLDDKIISLPYEKKNSVYMYLNNAIGWQTLFLKREKERLQTMDHHHKYHWFIWPWKNKYCHSKAPEAQTFFSETSWNTANLKFTKQCLQTTDLKDTTLYLISQKMNGMKVHQQDVTYNQGPVCSLPRITRLALW
jgi:hypothetical protein